MKKKNEKGPVHNHPKEKIQKFGKILWDDLHSGIFRRSLWDEIREIYQFYVGREERERIAMKGPIRRGLHGAYHILKNLILKLSSFRRLLLLVSLILLLLGMQFTLGHKVSVNFNLKPLAYVLLLLILLLELKDKLLALDELEMGRKVQFALLPKNTPHIPGWEVWMFTRPANEVGGDLVDYLILDPRRVGLVLGDVAGKGLGAALYMAKLQATWRVLAPEAARLSIMGKKLNMIFCRDGMANKFISLVYLELAEKSGKVRVLNAGHIPPLVLQKGRVREVERGDPALGIKPGASFHEHKMSLTDGDMLLVYSDGLSEACNRQGAFFGEKRVHELFSGLGNLHPGEAGMRLVSEADTFTGDARPHDDLSIIILKKVPAGHRAK